jgi:hypothetical protein
MLAKDGNGTPDFKNGNEDGWPGWLTEKGTGNRNRNRRRKRRTK